MYAILSRLVNHQAASNQTDIRHLCQTLMNALRRKSVVFILSDFICDNYDTDFRRLAQKHDVIPVIIQDPIEQGIPNAGTVLLKDAETGMRLFVIQNPHHFNLKFKVF